MSGATRIDIPGEDYHAGAWDLTESYCPACGRREVWVQDAAGDVYCGPPYVCAGCGAEGREWNWQPSDELSKRIRDAAGINTAHADGK